MAGLILCKNIFSAEALLDADPIPSTYSTVMLGLVSDASAQMDV